MFLLLQSLSLTGEKVSSLIVNMKQLYLFSGLYILYVSVIQKPELCCNYCMFYTYFVPNEALYLMYLDKEMILVLNDSVKYL